MKKLILLVAVAAFATSCNSKASVNHGILPVEHEPATAEEMHHKAEAAHEGHAEHAEEAEETHTEVKDSTKTVETPAKEVKDSTKAGH